VLVGDLGTAEQARHRRDQRQAALGPPFADVLRKQEPRLEHRQGPMFAATALAMAGQPDDRVAVQQLECAVEKRSGHSVDQ
jgi:hypothetical protein